MISEEIVQDIDVAVKEIMKTEGVDGYKYEIEGKSESGDNYMGEVIFLRVDPEKNNSKPYHFVAKTAKRSAELRKKFPVQELYARELFMYSDVFPNFRKFVQEVNPQFEFEFIPELYWTNAEEMKETVVLENLKPKGFKLCDRTKPWNLEHSHFTMKHYGKLHAISMALRDQRPELFSGLRKSLGAMAQGFQDSGAVKKFYDEPFEHVMNLLRKVDRDDLAKKFYILLDEVEDIFNDKTEEKDKLAICHMDCWNNNFLFKYEGEDESSPSEIRFLDFQLSCLESPAKDLSYNIYATCDNRCFEHFDELLETYHDSLTESLKSLGSDPQKFLSMEDLRRHWRKYGIYGLFFAITIIKFELIDKTDAPSMEDMAKNENIMDGFNIKVKDQDEYDRRILEVFLHFGDNFL